MPNSLSSAVNDWEKYKKTDPGHEVQCCGETTPSSLKVVYPLRHYEPHAIEDRGPDIQYNAAVCKHPSGPAAPSLHHCSLPSKYGLASNVKLGWRSLTKEGWAQWSALGCCCPRNIECSFKDCRCELVKFIKLKLIVMVFEWQKEGRIEDANFSQISIMGISVMIKGKCCQLSLIDNLLEK